MRKTAVERTHGVCRAVKRRMKRGERGGASVLEQGQRLVYNHLQI